MKPLLEALRAVLDEAERSVRAALEAPSPEGLERVRGEMFELANRLDAVRVVQENMSALAQQSTGMWEARLRASRQAIERALMKN